MENEDEAILWAYRLFYEREPENQEVIDQHREHVEDYHQLRTHFLNSQEFCEKNQELFSSSFVGHKPPLPIEVKVSPKELENLFKRVESAWEHFGKIDPHWSVLSADRFKKENIEASMEEFYQSGRPDADLIDRTLKRNGIDFTEIRSCTEIGCGLGRLTRWLSKKFEKITAYDISSGHLSLADKHLKSQGINNVDFKKFSGLKSFKNLPKTDFAFSIIVLQHNPPPIMAYMIQGILKSLKRGGYALFQAPTYLDNYSFILNDYLNIDWDPKRLEMHVMPQNIIFQIIEACGCRVIECVEDSYIGRPPGGISNTFLVQKKSMIPFI